MTEQNFSDSEIIDKISAIRNFFSTTHTNDLGFRLYQLKNFRNSILKFEDEIYKALWSDLRKSKEEAYLTEVSLVLKELDKNIKYLKKWSKAKRVPTPWYLRPSRSKLIYEPLGIALIIAPWNYPFQLLLTPLVGAMAAGNCAVLKPSEHAPAIAEVMNKIIANSFDERFVTLFKGKKETNQLLLEQKFDIIFFTGSTKVGKIVMQAAAKNLTPVVLELGGKSPCIVDKEANINRAAKRIAWGKTINAGQTCIAPDYLFVHKSIKEELIEKIIENLKKMYGEDAQNSKYFPRIINEQALNRVSGLMNEGKTVHGGQVDKTDKYISPTIIDEVKTEHAIMQEEIFGPVLPVLSFTEIDNVIEYINKNEKPLAFYYFGKNKKAKEVLVKTSSGGSCINDTIMHIANHQLPFGGVGNSGIGKYHGYNSFLTFSNQRAIVTTPTWFDLPLKYVPFKGFRLLKRIV